MPIPRVVFLSPPCGEEQRKFLQSLYCEVVDYYCHDNPPCLDDVEYDLGINYLGSHKISKKDIDKAKYGFVNFHPAPLPEFGGRNLAYHAIMTQAKEFGATIHYMSENYDEGDIIECQRFSMQSWHTAGRLVIMSHRILADLFEKWVPVLLKGRVDATPQTGTTYFKKETINDTVELNPEQELRVRALTCLPKHHAVTLVGGNLYKIVPVEDRQ